MVEFWSKQLLYTSDPYKKGTVLFEKSIYTTEVTLNIKQKIVCSLELVGAGGGYGGLSTADGHYWAGSGTGGSGAAFVGIIAIPAGTCKLKVGLGGKNADGNLTKGVPGEASYLILSSGKGITAGGGDAASAVGNTWNNGGGKGGILNITDSGIVKSETIAANGNNGPSEWSIFGLQPGAKSVYKSYGEGCKQPTSGESQKGGDGYLRLIYLGTSYIKGLTETLAEQLRK